jgi:hypothetical protein
MTVLKSRPALSLARRSRNSSALREGGGAAPVRTTATKRPRIIVATSDPDAAD